MMPFTLRQAIIYGTAFTSAMLIGYDSGYLNGVLASADFKRRYGRLEGDGETWYLTSRTRSLFTSMLVVGTVLGCCLPGFLPDQVGRKGCFLLAASMYAVGVALQTAALAAGVFILGRIVIGVSLGIISVTTPVYLIESSSAKSRGRLITLYQQLLTCGNVLACSISMGTSHLAQTWSWRITVAFQLALALFVLGGAVIAPESPTILMRRNQPDKARHSLHTLRNISLDSTEMGSALNDITSWLDGQRSFGRVSVLQCFQGTDLRRTLIGAGMAFMTIATGVTFWFGYGTTFFEAAGVHNSYLVSLILAVVNFIFTAPSVYVIEAAGRRTCMFVGGAIMGTAYLMSSIAHSVAPGSPVSNNILITSAVLFIAAYAATWGPAGWVIMTEPFSARLRTYATSVTMVIYWITTWAVGFVTPYIVDESAAGLGVNITYLWLGMVVLSLLWGFTFVPELAGLSAAEVDLLFETKVPAWKSKTWARQLKLDGLAVEHTSDSTDVVPRKELGQTATSTV